MIDEYFLKIGFHRSECEPTPYKKINGSVVELLICLSVDDIICMGSSQSIVDKFKARMIQPFEMPNLGSLNYLLGLEIKQAKG